MKNILLGLALMLSGSFVFSAESVEITKRVDSETPKMELKVNSVAESTTEDLVGCYSTVFVKSRKTGKVVYTFVRYDPDCDSDYQTEVIWI